MTNISKSPDRNTFQAQSYIKKLEEDPTDEAAKSMVELYQKWRDDADVYERNPAWQENNMEYDLRSTDWILEKVRASDTYAQNLYAAICNNTFQKLEVLPILKEQSWGASWRSAGGIIANMRMQGDYIDWYCSGIGEGLGNGDADGTKYYVGESVVTDEIREDLKRLGWVVLDEDMENDK